MGFGESLVGKSSHESLLRVQDAELKLLDTIQHFISMRVENDRKYAAGLAKILQYTGKIENSEFKECCSVFKAWDVILKETETLMKTVRYRCDHMSTHTLDVLGQLIAEKKGARRKYMEERLRLDNDFTKVQDDVFRLKQKYVKSVERLASDKARYNDLQARVSTGKNKAPQKLDEAKTKFFQSVVSLHKLHNDYILSVQTAAGHQASLRDKGLPAVLDCHQATQEALVYKSKYVLEDYLASTDTCSKEFQDMTNNITGAIESVKPGAEYSTTFTDLHKSSLQPPAEFTFDPHLLEQYSGESLKPNTIEVSELTVEPLKQKLSRLTQEIEDVKEKLSNGMTEQHHYDMELTSLAPRLAGGPDITDINNYLSARSCLSNQTKDLAEIEGRLSTLETLVNVVKQPLDEIGDQPPPPARDMQDQADISFDNTKSTKSIFGKIGQAFKGKSTAGSGGGGMNNTSEDDISVSDDFGPEDVPETRKKPGASYETHSLTKQHPPNGAERLSMMAMRQQGLMVDVDVMESKTRMADEDWFHGVLPREEVQRLLVTDGDYLVRESKNKKSNETQFVLSVYWSGHKHFIIQFNAERGWHFEGQAYPTIPELVRRQFESRLPVTTKSGAVLKTPILREWELLNDDIELKMKIGTGNFGEVYKGVYKRAREVAVKTCKDTLTEDQKLKFLQEGRILKQYNHPNIVKYIGIAAQKQPVMIVMEFIPKGALLQFLKSHGASQTRVQLTQMCCDASSGMEYLEARNCIHRDLAARNCLVGENNVIKISDFGMSREEQEYHVSQGMKQIPVKWTAPEALNYGKYTSLCDVWSFGVLMWEIFSHGKSPYTGMNNSRAREWIEEGHRLEKPSGTPESVFALMRSCWEYHDENRPHFNTIHKTLQDIIKKL